MKWEYMFNKQTLNRGKMLYKNSRVKSMTCIDGVYYAIVQDGSNYEVKIKIGMNAFYYCNCPVSLDGYMCSHVAAALYSIDKIEAKKMENVAAAFERKLIDPFEESGAKTAGGAYSFFDIKKLSRKFKFYENNVKEARAMIQRQELVLKKVSSGYAQNRFDNSKGKLTVICNGLHKGSRDVTATFDSDEILEVRCTIPGCYHIYNKSMQYSQHDDEMCPHQIAILILIRNYLMANPIGDFTDFSGIKLLKSYREKIKKERVGKTKRENEAFRDEVLAKLRIEPRIEEEEDGIFISFKAGTDKLYVVKELGDFVHTVDEKGTLKFGAKTEIDCTVTEIAKDSEKYMRFISRYIKEQEHRRNLKENAGYGSWYKDVQGDIRNRIELYGAGVDEIFDMLNGKKIDFNSKIDARGGKKFTLISFKDGKPKIELELKNAIDNSGVFHGVILSGSVPNIIEGVRYKYCIKDGTFYRLNSEMQDKLAPLLEISDRGNINIKVGRNNLTEFYYRILPIIREVAEVSEDEDDQISKVIPPEVKFEFYLDVEDGKSVCSPKSIYGDKSYETGEVIKNNYYKRSDRDDVREKEALETVTKYFPEIAGDKKNFYAKSDEDTVYEILENGVPELSELGTVKCTDDFSRLKIREKSKIKVGVSVNSDIMNLDINTGDLTHKELLEVLSSYKKKKRYHRLRNGEFLKLQEDRGLEELSMLLDTLSISDKAFEKGNIRVPLYRALYVDKMLEKNESIYAERDKHFKSLVKNFKTVDDSDFEIPESLKSILRPYQVYGHKWLRTVAEYGFGGILADDMGLGKTLQVISVLLAERQEAEAEGRKLPVSLIISPASLVYNWAEEFSKFAPNMKVGMLAGNAPERKELITNYREYDVLVTSYDLLKRDIEEYEKCIFDFEIIDEAQYIKNHTTAAAKAVKVITSKIRFALTGTPIENRLSELWSIFDYLMPGFLYGYETFRKAMEIPITKFEDEETSKRLRRMVSPFILRRLKKDVLKDLPDKLEEVYYAKFNERQQHLYDGQVVHMKQMLAKEKDENISKKKIEILAELTKLRQICCDPSLLFTDYDGESAKREACVELIKSAIEGEHRMLIFSQFTSMLDLLAKDLDKEGIKYYSITGNTGKKDRVDLVTRFNTGDVPVFLISLKAGGTGLNLVGADMVIHYDPWWNIAVQNQATDRAYRIGQTKEVSVIKLIAKGSIEEKILEMQETKKNLAEGILSGESTSIAAMSKDELLELLGD